MVATLVDTGASISILPIAAMSDPEDHAGWRVLNVLTGRHLLRSFLVRVQAFGIDSPELEIACASDSQLAAVLPDGAPIVGVLGRDVLNHVRFAFDGPAGEISAAP
jgi:hypothetical protein